MWFQSILSSLTLSRNVFIRPFTMKEVIREARERMEERESVERSQISIQDVLSVYCVIDVFFVCQMSRKTSTNTEWWYIGCKKHLTVPNTVCWGTDWIMNIVSCGGGLGAGLGSGSIFHQEMEKQSTNSLESNMSMIYNVNHNYTSLSEKPLCPS